ncbi:MAG: ComEC/Rec2 family competence protein [Anaerolineales bacterium]|nr:ComEC/Rec2 family competence protein [Anaerolineales bacterium]
MESSSGAGAYFKALPLLWLSPAFLAGIWLASWLAAPAGIWLLLAGAAGAIAWALRARAPWAWLALLAAASAAALGAARYQAAQPVFGPGDLASYNDRGDWVYVEGEVSAPPEARETSLEVLLAAEQLGIDDREIPVRGKLLVQLGFGPRLQYGDRLRLWGQLSTPRDSEDFSYRSYLARQSVYSLMAFPHVEQLEAGQGEPFWAALYGLRGRGVDLLYQLYPAEEAALLAGILLGDESGLSRNLKEAFNISGTRHIIAISGFNISIIAGIFLSAFSRWLGQRRGLALAAVAISVYTLLVGADAAVVRAAIMGLLGLLALRTGRQGLAYNTLAVSAGLMALVNPHVLWDVSFQLSFVATLGLVLYAGPLGEWLRQALKRRLSPETALRLQGPLNDYLLLTLAAQVTTLPLLLYHFGRLSPYALPANILILPAQPALMMLGGASLLAGLLWLPLGRLLAFLVWGLAAYSIRISELFAGLPGATLALPIGLIAVLVYYAGLGALGLRRPLAAWLRKLRLRRELGLAALAAATLWLWSAAFTVPDGRLTLTLLDVPGEAILLRTPQGRYLLIHGGASPAALVAELRRELPPGQRLDWLLVAGARREQIGALAQALPRLQPGQVALAAAGNAPAALWELAAEQALPVAELQPGDQFDLGDGGSLQVLARGPRGAVLQLSYADFSALLPLGLDFDLLDELLAGGTPPAQLVLLADGGFPGLNPPEWLDALLPQLLWTTGEPQALGYPLLSSQANGWLRLSTDGSRMWLETRR